MDAVLLTELQEQVAALSGDTDGLLSAARVALLEKLVTYRDNGTITPAEYADLKAKIFR